MDVELFIPKGEISFHKKINGMPDYPSFFVPEHIFNLYAQNRGVKLKAQMKSKYFKSINTLLEYAHSQGVQED